MVHRKGTVPKPDAYGADDAGNYISVVLYDPEGCRNPALVRKSLQRLPIKSYSNRPLPRFCDQTRCALLTNWLFPMNLEFPSCELLLHMPSMVVGDRDNVCDAPFDVFIVFQATSAKYGIMHFHKYGSDQTIPAGSIIGEKIMN